MHNAREVGRFADQIVVFGSRAGDAGGVGLLERVIADEVSWHLAGETDQGDAVHQRIDKAGDGIGGARTGSDENNAHFPGAAGVTLCGVNRCLLMADENMTNGVLVEQRIVNRQNGSARIAENDIDILILQGTQENFSSGLGSGFTHDSSFFWRVGADREGIGWILRGVKQRD